MDSNDNGSGKQIKMTRRDILNALGFAVGGNALLSPTAILFESLLNGMVNKALAAGTTPRRYLYIQQPGAPSRWMWDLFLTPYSATGYQAHPMVGTRFVAEGGRYTGLRYETVLRKGINVPYLWQIDVPAPGGATRPMDGLLDNLFCIRGVNTGNNGHPGSQALHFKPLGAKKSLPALSADDSEAPIAAINISAKEYDFTSTKNKASVSLGNTGNLLTSLLNPFRSAASVTYAQKKETLTAAINQAMTSLENDARAEHPGAAVVIESRRSAEKLLQTGFGDLNTIWNNLLAKYQDLVTRSISTAMVIPGINDLPVGPTGTRSRIFQLDNNIVTNADLRTMIVANTQIQFMAAHFAVAEYVLLNNMSSSITIAPRSMTGLNAQGASGTHPFDEHFTGSMIALLLNAHYNRAMSACLLELIARLKQANQFNDTLIDISGEFNRSARTNSEGSDHAFEGASVALYSGAIQGPHVVGNIQASVRGGYGYGAPVAGVGVLTPSHVAATVAHMLRVASPVTAVNSLAVTQDNVVRPNPGLERARTV